MSHFLVIEWCQVLVLQEKTGHFQGTGSWKFPTGIADQVNVLIISFANQYKKLFLGLYNLLIPLQGEDICAAAVREVKEETGVSDLFAVPIECVIDMKLLAI